MHFSFQVAAREVSSEKPAGRWRFPRPGLAWQRGIVPTACINRSLITVATAALWTWVLIDSWITGNCWGKRKKISLPFGNVSLMVLANKPQADYFRKTSHFLFCGSSESTQQCFLYRKGYVCGRADWRLGPVLAHLWHHQHRQRWVSTECGSCLCLWEGASELQCVFSCKLVAFLVERVFSTATPLRGCPLPFNDRSGWNIRRAACFNMCSVWEAIIIFLLFTLSLIVSKFGSNSLFFKKNNYFFKKRDCFLL